MTYQDLINNIQASKIPASLYSIEEGLKPNAYILYRNYDKWEYFFLSERGDKLDQRIFDKSEIAFDFFWEKLQNELKYPPSVPPSSIGIC